MTDPIREALEHLRTRSLHANLPHYETLRDHIARLTAERDRLATDGFKLVPVKPTEAMLKAVFPLHYWMAGRHLDGVNFIDEFAKHYAIAVAAFHSEAQA